MQQKLKPIIPIFLLSLLLPISVFASCGTDTVKDSDNNTYHTVRINNQCWMQENMNVGTKLATGATNPTDNGQIEKWCYNNDDSICATDGGFYNWNEAMKYSTTEGAQGICPNGWHIPKDSEWYTLENYLKDDGQSCDPNRDTLSDDTCQTTGIKLKVGGGSGMNTPGGGRRSDDGSFGFRPLVDYFWTSTKNGNLAYFRRTAAVMGLAGFQRATTASNAYGMSIRCLRNPDSTPPTTNPSISEGAYNSQKNLTLTCSDDNIGCDQIYYTTDGSTPTTSSNHSSSPLNLTISSTTTLKYFAKDYNSNSESVNSKTYTIDTTAPDNNSNDLELKTDNKKDDINIEKTQYIDQNKPQLNGENPEAANGTISIYKKKKSGGKDFLGSSDIDEDGNWSYHLPKQKKSKTVTYYIKTTDEAGNESGYSKGIKFYLDTTDPVFANDHQSSTNITNGNQTINFEATDNETEVVYYKLELIQNNKVIKSWRRQHSTFYIVPEDVKPGSYTLIIRAYDKAGNKGEKMITVNVR